MRSLLIFTLVGAGAQLVDGALGMAFGVTATTLLVLSGVGAAQASAAIHLAEVGTTFASGLSHWKFKNIDWVLVLKLGGPGAVGAFLGATLLSSLSTEHAAPLMAAILVAIFLAFGAEVKGGPAAVLVIMAVAALLVLAIGGVGQVLAIRTGSQEAVAATFPLVFVGIFMSSAFFPTALMSGWFRVVAENNPIPWVIDPTRRLVIAGWSTGDAIQAMAVPAAVTLVTVSLAILALHRKLGRP